MSTSQRAIAAATLLISAACAGAQSSLDRLQAQPTAEFRGHYTAGPGRSWFRPCGSAPADSAWWATITSSAVQTLDAARRDGRLVDDRPVYVRWHAVQTMGGEVGPRGPGKPALLVREVITLRAPGAGDCGER